MRIRVLADAEAEIESARRYLDGQQPGLGARFLDELTDTLASIANRPYSFAKLETLANDQPYRRALLGAFRYAIVFDVLTDEIIIVAAAHCSRAPNYWLGRQRPS